MSLAEEKSVAFDVNKLRLDFPILQRKVHGKNLVYVDNAASMQKPKSVLDKMDDFYLNHYSNIHRSVHLLSQEATTSYESVRQKLCSFFSTDSTEEIIFTKGTTDAVNLVAASLGDLVLCEGDEIVVSRMEHHANFVAWQSLAKRKKAHFKIVELADDFSIDKNAFKNALSSKTKIVALSAMSNVLGTANDLAPLVEMAKQVGAYILVDAAQWAAHLPMNISKWGDIDFCCFSAHKIGGPTGVGALWGKKKVLQQMSPYQFGGDMILNVGDLSTEWNELPYKFEAGTPAISEVIGMGEAIDYLQSWGLSELSRYEEDLCSYALDEILKINELSLFGSKEIKNRAPVFSFAIDGIHPHDLGTFLDHDGVAVRAGHHCAQPLHAFYKLGSTTRASFCFYNTKEEVDKVTESLKRAIAYFKK